MEHYYVITGNEFGANLFDKKNFSNLEKAKEQFEKSSQDDYTCLLIHVDNNGKETTVKIIIKE